MDPPYFDPYHTWLGIPPEEQPPNHYRLLGIPCFEKSVAVIEHAADRQMAHLHTLQTGKYGPLSQKLLNEVASAKICLLHPQRKAEYDNQLAQTLSAHQIAASFAPPAGVPLVVIPMAPPAPPVAVPVPESPPVESVPAELFGLRAESSRVGPVISPLPSGRNRTRQRAPAALWIFIGGLLVVLFLTLLVLQLILPPRDHAVDQTPPVAKVVVGPAEDDQTRPVPKPLTPANPPLSKSNGDSERPWPKPRLPGVLSPEDAALVPDNGLLHRTDRSVLIMIPEGRFFAGEPGKEIEVALPNYLIGYCEVSNRQYKQFVDATGHATPATWPNGVYPAELADCAVMGVSWHDAAAYCRWAGLRLPTELEWEKAARGMNCREYPWGNRWLPRACNSLAAEARAQAMPVRSFPEGRSPWGLYHMSGNAWEWCADWYDPAAYENYGRGSLTPPGSGSARAARGGSWEDVQPEKLKTWCRMSFDPATRSPASGFRVAKDVTPDLLRGADATMPETPDVAKPPELGGVKAPLDAKTPPALKTPPKLESQDVKPPPEAKPGATSPGSKLVSSSARLPIPGELACRKALKEARDQYREAVSAAKSGSELANLARKLLDAAAQPETDATARFGLFLLARELAVESADQKCAFEVIERTADVFAVDRLDLKRRYLNEKCKTLKTVEEHQAMAIEIVELLDIALKSDLLPMARELGGLALAEAIKAKDNALANEIRNRNREIENRSKVAKPVLDSRPASPAKSGEGGVAPLPLN